MKSETLLILHCSLRIILHAVDFNKARENMVEHQLVARGITSVRVLDAMRKVPRHVFVEEALQDSAYEDYPIPIGEGQTISQPYMVALMTELLDLNAESVVLEIGTGSGYQAAVLAQLAKQVYTVERLAKLAATARIVLDQLKCYNVQIRVGDGTLGWSEYAPYDGIIVTAGAPSVPETLIGQLAENGKLVIPVGDRFSQVLQVITKQANRLETKTSCHCVFVKLIGKNGWSE
jgi:protein-L-isoaspartate(D-aspartate) O-methyltransferase